MDLDVYSDDESENGYTEKEKGLLKQVKNRSNKNVERSNAVLGFDDEDSEDDFDEEEDNADDDDLLGSGEDYDGDIPDERAWGKNKRSYYDTGFVDQDYSTFNEKEEELAEQEEKEAKAIQLRLAQEFDEMDYKLDSFVPTESSENKKIGLDNVFKTDLSNISKREKLQLFKKDSPEFEELVQDFLFHLEESQKYLEPIQLHFNNDNIDHPLINFVKTRNNLILNYCTNIAFYLVLKSKKMFNKSHPIIKRLFQFRKLLLQLDEKYNDVIKPQLEVLLEKIENGEDINLTPPEEKARPQKLNILKNLEKGTTGSTKSKKVDKSVDISKEDLDDIRAELNDNDSSDEEQNDEDMDDQNPEEVPEIAEEEQKRGITYEIQKNKGLMPHRKKENRNPRVKHRNKYKKALVRRKGAVRTVRKEISRYAGELSGIKANVVKGIKIK